MSDTFRPKTHAQLEQEQAAAAFREAMMLLTLRAATGIETDVEETARAMAVVFDAAQVPPSDTEDGEWRPGEYIQAGYVRQYKGKGYECIQPHCTQADWTPDATPALWAEVKQAGDEWVQPESTNPYAKGDIVLHKDKFWISTIDGNVWEPGVYGWEEYEG